MIGCRIESDDAYFNSECAETECVVDEKEKSESNYLDTRQVNIKRCIRDSKI